MGDGNFEDYGMRMYNTRLGRFFNVDPLTKSYPMLTPYQFASNTPIQAIDLDGLEAKIAIYGAGVHWNDNGTSSEKHAALFKSEADKDVQWKNANKAYKGLVGQDLIKTLEKISSNEGSIEYMSMYTHAGPNYILLDTGQFGREALTDKTINTPNTPYSTIALKDIFDNSKIKFELNSLVVFAGCNAGRTVSFEDRTVPIYSIAKEVTETYGIATIGADGYTSPSKKTGNRTADYNYTLFYIDIKNQLQTVDLGKELNKATIQKAKQIVDKVAEERLNSDKNEKPK